MPEFDLHSPYQPMGDQPQAIAELVNGVNSGLRHQVLLGATGTGKTYTIAQVVMQTQAWLGLYRWTAAQALYTVELMCGSQC